MAIKTIIWTVSPGNLVTMPSDFGALIKVEAIAAGGNGGSIQWGAGGGAYAVQTSVSGLTSGASVAAHIGQPGGSQGTKSAPGTADTWFKAAATVLYAQGAIATSNLGGAAKDCFPTSGATSGGSGDDGSFGGLGGGGAGGPNGDGISSSGAIQSLPGEGGNGDNNSGGSGGTLTSGAGRPGGNGAEWGTTGSGGGGAQGSQGSNNPNDQGEPPGNGFSGGAGGSLGGGGGGGGVGGSNQYGTGGPGGGGQGGIGGIRLTYLTKSSSNFGIIFGSLAAAFLAFTQLCGLFNWKG